MALKLDPAAPPFIGSYNIIRERLIASFKEMDATDAAIPTVFRLIADLGAVDAPVLVKHSQHLAAEGDQQEALAVAQQAVELEPVTSEALRHVARLLAGVGRHEEARAHRREADAMAVTFACPKAEA
jgi:Flp pilus assembly protein TadD